MQISDMKADCAALVEQREKINKMKLDLEFEQAKFDTLKMKIIMTLNDNGLKTFASDDVKVTKVEKLNVSITDEAAFREYLEKNDLDHLRKVNYQTLQSLYKEQVERAIEAGESDIEIPGITLSSAIETLQIRKI